MLYLRIWRFQKESSHFGKHIDKINGINHIFYTTNNRSHTLYPINLKTSLQKLCT